MDFSETLTYLDNINYLCKSYNFFPLSGLQVGRWLSAFHIEGQLFLYHPSPETLVFLAVNSEGWQNANSQYFLTYTRKELLKMLKNSPFATPVKKKIEKNPRKTFLDRIGAQYCGVVAFEINLSEIEGIDYSNTLNSYGSRITLEVNKGKKLWFSSVSHFCSYYSINQPDLKTKYYNPCISEDSKSFYTKRLHPEYFGFKCRRVSVTEQKDFLKVSTPDPKRFRTKVKRSLSVCATLDESFSEETLFETDTHESKFNDFTIVGYFDDPIFPYFVKDLLSQPKNKFLLTKYERGIPSWAQFLPSYGLPYRPWMRKAMAVIIFLFSFFTMILGFYDLCNKVPQLKEIFYSAFGDCFSFIEQMIIFRLSMIFGYVYYFIQLVMSFILYVLCTIPFVSGIAEFIGNQVCNLASLIFGVRSSFEWVSSGFVYVYRLGKSVLTFFYETLYFNELVILFYSGFINIFCNFVRFLWFLLAEMRDFVVLVFRFPIDLLCSLTYGVFSMIAQILLDIYYFFYSIFAALRYVLTIFRSNSSGIVESRGWWTIIKEFWDNIFRHVLKGITSIYHFVVYTSCNVYKHKDSMIVSFWIYYRHCVLVLKQKMRKYKFLILAYFLVILTYKLRNYALSTEEIN